MKTNRTVFHILDLDRTLLDTLKLAHHLKELIFRHDPQLSHDIDNEIIKHAENRTSFFLFEYIVERLGEARMRNYIDELHQVVPTKELLLPGALERIAYAKSQHGWGVGILTFGSKRDQIIKLKLVGLQMERHLVTDSPHKGDTLASWRRRDGRFKLPIEFGGHIVDTLTLDDDKIVAFDNLPDNVYGQWVTHASIGGPLELPELPPRVKVVNNLEESIEYLKTKLL